MVVFKIKQNDSGPLDVSFLQDEVVGWAIHDAHGEHLGDVIEIAEDGMSPSYLAVRHGRVLRLTPYKNLGDAALALANQRTT